MPEPPASANAQTLPPVSPDEGTLGMLAHVLQIVSWFIAPIIICLVRKDSKFVRYHALQAIFFHLLVLLVWGATFMMLLAGFVAAVVRYGQGDGSMAVGLALLFPLVFWGGVVLSWVLNLVLGIVYGIRASRGEWAGYPGIKYLAAKAAGVELPN